MKRVLSVAVLALVLSAVSSGRTWSATIEAPMSFGAFPGAATRAAAETFESNAGRQLAYVRVYDRWDDTFPDAQTTWMRSGGRSLFLSIKARRSNGTNVSWQAIADSQPGSPLYADMQRWARQIKAYGLPMYVAFNHEPDTANSQRSGTATAFIAAWRKFVSVMDAEGVTNAQWAWTTAARNYNLDKARYAPDYYPGDQWVDVIAIDAYNMYCKNKRGVFANPWRSLEQVLAPFMAFASQHPGPSLVVAEWGSPEDPADPLRKATWIAQAQQLFKQPGYERFVGVSYWNQLSREYVNCDFRITSSAAALDAFKAMGADPFYGGSSQ